MLFMLYTPLSSNLWSLFWKNASRLAWGARFWKLKWCKIMAKRPSPALQSHKLHPFWNCLLHLAFAKSIWKMYISRLLEALFAIVWLTTCTFKWHFRIFAMLLSSFCWKMDAECRILALKAHLVLPSRAQQLLLANYGWVSMQRLFLFSELLSIPCWIFQHLAATATSRIATSLCFK